MTGLVVENLTVTARTTAGNRKLVDGLSFAIPPGEALAIVGASGSGKTMTAMALLGLLPHGCQATGRATLGELELLALSGRHRRRLLGDALVLVPQSGADCLSPLMTVEGQWRETLSRLGCHSRREQQQRAAALMKQVELDCSSLWSKYPFQLSGGMAQRLVLAMGMAGCPRLVVADEPTAGVDDETARGFMEGLSRYFPEAALLLVTHNLAQAMACPRQLLLEEGRENREGVEAWLRCCW